MKSAFIFKTRINVVKSFNNESSLNNFVRIVNIEKIALRAYNRCTHHREMNNFFYRKLFDKIVDILYFFKKIRVTA